MTYVQLVNVVCRCNIHHALLKVLLQLHKGLADIVTSFEDKVLFAATAIVFAHCSVWRIVWQVVAPVCNMQSRSAVGLG